MSTHLRTLWLSDIHLGTAAARAGDLLEFLDTVTADRVYLNGDIIDIERLRVKPAFPPLHWQVVNRFVRMAKQGMEVIYIPGNHDHEIRELAGSHLCGIRVALEARHRTSAGEKLLVTHGDCLDGRIRKGTNLEAFGAAAYTWLVEADAKIGRLRDRLGHDHRPIATRIKSRLRTAREYIARFERSAAEYARERVVAPLVAGLGERLAAIVLQLPPQREPAPDAFARSLGHLLGALPPGPRYGVEIRSRAWLGEKTRRALRDGGALPCFTVHPAMPGLAEQVRALGGPAAWDALLLRWNLGGDRRYAQARDRHAPFDRIVDPDPATLVAVADLARRATAAGRPAFVSINNKAEGCAPRTAERLAAAGCGGGGEDAGAV